MPPAIGNPRYTATIALLLTGLTLAGCQATGRAPQLGDVPRESTAELMLFVSNEPYVTAEPAYRVVYALQHGEAFTGDFDALRAALVSDGIIASSWPHAPDQYVNRGTIAYMVCKACEIRTGLNWVLTGLGRYAWRELQYRGIAGPGGELGLMRGGELTGLILRAEDYRRSLLDTKEASVELGSPPR